MQNTKNAILSAYIGELPTPNQRLWCWLPASTAFAITEDLRPLAGLTLPPLAVASVPEASTRNPSSRILIEAFISLSCFVWQL